MRSSARNIRKPTINCHPMLTRSKLRYWMSQELPKDLDLLHQITNAAAVVNIEDTSNEKKTVEPGNRWLAGNDNGSAICAESAVPLVGKELKIEVGQKIVGFDHGCAKSESSPASKEVALKLKTEGHLDAQELVKGGDTYLAECDNESATCTEDSAINDEVTTIKQEPDDETSAAKEEPNSSLSSDILDELRRDVTRLMYLRLVIAYLKGVMEMSDCPCDPCDCVGARQRVQSEETLKKG